MGCSDGPYFLDMDMKDILDRIADSSANESSHELICRLRDCAHEIEALRSALACRPDAQADERYDLLQAAVNCPHEIESNRVVLHYSDKQPGHNALAQLRERLTRAAAPQAGAAQGAPEGYALMPIDPTIDMLMLVYDPGAEEAPSERYKKLLSLGAGAPYPDREQAPYSAPFTTDVPHCCGEPETCNDPCDASPSRECGERQGAALSIVDIEALAIEHLYVGDDDVVFGTEKFARAIECAVLAASAPTLGEHEWPSDRDAAIQACALMILGICKTEPQEVWPKRIEGRIRYMLSKIDPAVAQPGLTNEQRETIQHAADKLRTVWANHTGDKESRELCHKLEALLAKGE